MPWRWLGIYIRVELLYLICYKTSRYSRHLCSGPEITGLSQSIMHACFWVGGPGTKTGYT